MYISVCLCIDSGETSEGSISMSDFELEELDQRHLEEILQEFLEEYGDDFDYQNSGLFQGEIFDKILGIDKNGKKKL